MFCYRTFCARFFPFFPSSPHSPSKSSPQTMANTNRVSPKSPSTQSYVCYLLKSIPSLLFTPLFTLLPPSSHLARHTPLTKNGHILANNHGKSSLMLSSYCCATLSSLSFPLSRSIYPHMFFPSMVFFAPSSFSYRSSITPMWNKLKTC